MGRGLDINVRKSRICVIALTQALITWTSFVHNCTPSLHVLITHEFLHDMNYNYSNTKSLP